MRPSGRLTTPRCLPGLPHGTPPSGVWDGAPPPCEPHPGFSILAGPLPHSSLFLWVCPRAQGGRRTAPPTGVDTPAGGGPPNCVRDQPWRSPGLGQLDFCWPSLWPRAPEVLQEAFMPMCSWAGTWTSCCPSPKTPQALGSQTPAPRRARRDGAAPPSPGARRDHGDRRTLSVLWRCVRTPF